MTISLQEYAQKVNDEKKELVKLWSQFGFFQKFTDEQKIMDGVVLLDNARLYAESIHQFNQFKRMFIPVTFRIFTKLVAPHIISVQPIYSEQHKCYLYFDDINEMQAEIKKQDVDVFPSRLNSSWHYENDLKVFTGNLDAEAEVAAILAHEISTEIDRRLITELREGAAHHWTWNFETAFGDTIREKYETLAQLVKDAATEIGVQNNRGPANWMITSPEIASIFEVADRTFQPRRSMDVSSPINYTGDIMNGEMKLIKDALAPQDILIGYRGSNLYDAGFFYTPKLLFRMGNDIKLNEDFIPVKIPFETVGATAWYKNGKQFYGRITVENFVF